MIDIHEILDNVKIDTEYERNIFRALGMLRERAIYWSDCACCNGEASAYSSAADILAYAMMGDWEALNQYDYYDDEDEDVTEEWACTPEEVNKVCEV